MAVAANRESWRKEGEEDEEEDVPEERVGSALRCFEFQWFFLSQNFSKEGFPKLWVLFGYFFVTETDPSI